MNWQNFILMPAKTVMEKFVVFLPQLVGVLSILLIGWGISLLIRKAVYKMLMALKVDHLTEKAGLRQFFEKGKLEGTLSEILAGFVYWVSMIVVFFTAFNAMGLTVTVELVDKLIIYVRKVVAAIFIAILGVFFSNVMRSIVTTATGNAGIRFSSALGQMTRIVIIIFTVLTVLEQLQISTRVIEMAVLVFLSSIGLSIAIAFGVAVGLGAKDLAGRSMEEWVKKLKE